MATETVLPKTALSESGAMDAHDRRDARINQLVALTADAVGFDAGVLVTEGHMDECDDVLALLQAVADQIELRAHVQASDPLHRTLRLIGIAQAKLNALLDPARAVAPAARPPAA